MFANGQIEAGLNHVLTCNRTWGGHQYGISILFEESAPCIAQSRVKPVCENKRCPTSVKVAGRV